MWLIYSAVGVSLVLVLGLRRVRSGEIASLHRFGRRVGMLSPGLHWLAPGEAIAQRVSLLGRQFDIAPRYLRDGALNARVGGRVYYQVIDGERALAFGDALESRVQDAVLAQIGSTLAQLAAMPAGERNRSLRDDLRRRLGEDGIQLTRLELSIETSGLD
jgi:hypothetical protein